MGCVSERPVRITELPPLARGCFPVRIALLAPSPSRADIAIQKYVTLNRMQSIVQPTAMNTNENMLVCGEPDRDVDT
jgi:antiviral helicase SLH1